MSRNRTSLLGYANPKNNKLFYEEIEAFKCY